MYIMRRIETCALAIESLGPVNGMQAILSFARKAPGIRSVNIRNISQPVYIRFSESDWNVLAEVFFRFEYVPPSQEHEKRLDDYYKTLLDCGKTPVIVDCGANIGLTSVWYAKRFPHAKIFAVEPEKSNFEILEINARSWPNIIPVYSAISDDFDNVTVRDANSGAWGFQTIRDGSGSTPATTINFLISSVPHASPLIVKIDIEGFELELMKSNTEWISQTPLVVFEAHDWLMPWRGAGHRLFSALGKEPFDYLWRGENVFCFSHRLLAPQSNLRPLHDSIGNTAV